MMWLTLLKKLWPYIAGAALLAGAFVWYQAQISEARQAGYKAATDAMEVKLAVANAEALAKEEASRKRVNEAENAHQQLLSKLDDNYRANPLPAVRVCNDNAKRRSEVPSNTGAAPVDPGTPEGDGLPERDISAGLTRIARDADEQTARLIACQNYVRAIHKTPN